MNLKILVLILQTYFLVRGQLYLYEREHFILNINSQFGTGHFKYEGAQCNDTREGIINVDEVIRKQPKVRGEQDWPDSQVLKVKQC